MHRSNLANVVLATVFLVSCSPANRGHSAWDGYDYSKKGTTARDYDADYSLPTGAGVCMDDSPGCY